MRPTQSDFTFQFRTVKGHDFLMIEDMNLGRKSVTNNIENIIKVILDEYSLIASNLKFVYKDSEDIWDGYDFKRKEFINLCQKGWLQAALKMIELY